MKPKLEQWSPDLLCCERNTCAPIPRNTILYLNAEYLSPLLFRRRTGRASHCDCIVLAPCPGLGDVAAIYELKTMGILPFIAAELLDPRHSRHGARREAERIINELLIDTKLANCLYITADLVDELRLRPATTATVLVAGVEKKEDILALLRRALEGKYGEVNDLLLRAATSITTQVLREIITLLADRLQGRAEVIITRSRTQWIDICRELRRRENTTSKPPASPESLHTF